MANTVIALKKSATPGSTPSALANGELAINFADGKLFYKNTAGQIAEISGAGGGGNYFGTVNVNNVLIISDVPNDILTIDSGDNIILSANALNDSFTISANITPAFSQANTAYNTANDALAAAVALAIALG